jgi:hypothetical protein
MRRRTVIGGLVSSAVLNAVPRSNGMAADTNEYDRRAQEYVAKALANFPFELVETTGENAFAKWQELKTAGRGIPVIIGGDENGFGNLLIPFGSKRAEHPRATLRGKHPGRCGNNPLSR